MGLSSLHNKIPLGFYRDFIVHMDAKKNIDCLIVQCDRLEAFNYKANCIDRNIEFTVVYSVFGKNATIQMNL